MSQGLHDGGGLIAIGQEMQKIENYNPVKGVIGLLLCNLSAIPEKSDNVFSNDGMPSLLNSTFVTIKEQADAILQSPNIHSPNPASIEYIINITSARIKESLKEEHRQFFDQLG